MKKIFTVWFLVLFSATCYGITWDEPWQKEIIEQTDYLVYGKVLTASDTLVRIEILKSIGGELNGTIVIDGFSMLHLCSISGGQRPEFYMKADQEGYFFLTKGEGGNYHIPTPTSGFDQINKGEVSATYRHTYHKALVSPELYEMTYTAIWNHYHGKPYDTTRIQNFIDTQLVLPPAGFDEDEIGTFFKQHVALETAYLLGIQLNFEQVKKFIECDNFHAKVSSLRAMTHLKEKMHLNYMLKFVETTRDEHFLTVIALWSLWNIGDKRTQKKLWKLRDTLSTEEEGFGGNIMDHRVCTYLPSPKQAIYDLKGKEYKG